MTLEEVFNADRQRNIEINNLLQRIKYKVDKLQSGEEYVYFPIILVESSTVKYPESISNRGLFQEFKKWGAIEIIERTKEEMNETLEESKFKGLIVEGVLIKPINPKFYEVCQEYQLKTSDSTTPSGELFEAPSTAKRLRFDILNGVLHYGDALHAFHRGMRSDKPRLLLFKKLWDNRRHIKNRKEKIKGKALQAGYLAVQLNIASDNTVFDRNPRIKNKFYGLIKGINRILRDKHIPAKIERANGIQLVVEEKNRTEIGNKIRT